VANVARGEKCLHLSLEEPVGQLYRMLDNYGIDRGKLAGKLAVESYVPESLSPLHYYSILSDLMERHQPKFLVMDSITAMQHLLPREDFVKLMRYLQLMCKEKELTVMLTATLGKLELIQESGISTLADNIIIMRYYELKEKLGREIMILKTRGSDQDKKVTPFEIAGKGILVST
jgi:circadian clock protein KaiC